MGAVIKFVPLTDHGRSLLDQLEEATDEDPTEVEQIDGTRTYALLSEHATPGAVDAMLDRLDSNWREHLDRTPDEPTS